MRRLWSFLARILILGENREEEPNQYITNMRDGSMAGYKYFDFRSVKGITVETRGTGKGSLLVALDHPANIVGQADVVHTDVWSSTEINCDFADGIHALYLSYQGNGSFDIKCFSFTL